jgi:D-apionolactonase
MRNLIRDGSLGPIHSAGHEIVRRIFVTVRDRNWQEVAPSHWETKVDPERHTVTLFARHKSDLVDFEWRGTLELAPDHRSVHFAFEGKARRDMEVCRLGLIVLHPLEAMIGSRVTARSERAEASLTIPAQIAPQPIVAGIPGALTEPFSELKIERAGFGVLKLSFRGDMFELEDQRNWGDASFKSYCTPLRLGYPRAVAEGTRVAHRVDIRFEPAVVDAQEDKPRLPRQGTATSSVEFPKLGCEWRKNLSGTSGDGIPASYRHYYVDTTHASGLDDFRSLLERSPHARIEVGVDAQDHRALPSHQLSLVREHISQIKRVLVYGAGTGLPSAWAIESWRRAIQDATSSQVPVLAATRGYYVEYNRAAPLGTATQGIAFPLTATVHSDEVGTIVENAATVADMASTARQLMRLAELAIVPLALYYPCTPQQANFPPPLILPWLTATTIHAALSGITSITLAHDLIEVVRDVGANHVAFLRQLAESAGREVTPLDPSMPSGVHAMMLSARDESPAQVLATNLTSEVQGIALASSAMRACRCIDAATGAELPSEGAQIQLPGRSVVWIDVELQPVEPA